MVTDLFKVQTVGGASVAMSFNVGRGVGTTTLLLTLVRVVQCGSNVVGFQLSLGTQLLAVTQISVPSAIPVSVHEFMHGLGSTVAIKMPPA